MRKRLTPVIIVLIGIVVFIILRVTRDQPEPVGNQERAWRVATETISPDAFQPRLTLYGQLESPRRFTVVAPLSGLISKMKEGVIIINTARGAIINTEHIIAGLENGKIGALGIDVYEKEKGIFFNNNSKKAQKDNLLVKLIAMPNVLITGHHAFLTYEAITNIANTTIYNLSCWNNGRTTENELSYNTF